MPYHRLKPIEPLSIEECGSLLAACGDGSIGHRDRAMVALLWKSQLRAAELLALERRDWDRKRGTLNVRRGKGRKQRLVVMHESAAVLLDRWLQELDSRGHPGPLVFVSLRGRAMNRSNVRRMLLRLARRAGIEKRVHPHGMRHSGTRHLAEAGVSVPMIAAQLGHSNVATTSIYLEMMAPEERIKKLTQIGW